MDMLQSFCFSQAVSVPTQRCGQALGLWVHREEDAPLRFVSVCHSLSSDHLPVMRFLYTVRPEPRPVLRTVRNLHAVDMQQFRQDVAWLTAVQLDITADQFKINTEMRVPSFDPNVLTNFRPV